MRTFPWSRALDQPTGTAAAFFLRGPSSGVATGMPPALPLQLAAAAMRLLRRVEGEEGVTVRSGVVGQALVESRVESYHSENENISNLHSRSRSESESNVSASMENIRRISEQFFLTTKPNIRS